MFMSLLTCSWTFTLIILYDGLPMDFLFNSSLIMYRYRAIEDEGDNVVWHVPTRDKKPK